MKKVNALSNKALVRNKDHFKVKQVEPNHFVVLTDDSKVKKNKSKKKKKPVQPVPSNTKKKKKKDDEIVHVKIDNPKVSFGRKISEPKVGIRTSGLRMLEQEEEKLPKKTQVTTANGMQLNSSSTIRELGYTITRSREYRWKLLQNVIIPKVGKQQVIKHIEFLVKMNQSQPSKANAVYEWKYDLSRLKK